MHNFNKMQYEKFKYWTVILQLNCESKYNSVALVACRNFVGIRGRSNGGDDVLKKGAGRFKMSSERTRACQRKK
jgi:hypothetical protein